MAKRTFDPLELFAIGRTRETGTAKNVIHLLLALNYPLLFENQAWK